MSTVGTGAFARTINGVSKFVKRAHGDYNINNSGVVNHDHDWTRYIQRAQILLAMNFNFCKSAG
jgi:hypothetical protein